MTSFDVEYVGNSPGDIQERLTDINLEAKNRTNQALMETAREVKADLETSSPVDTGDYRQGWYIWPAKHDEVWILNEVDHAKYVMLPNSRMVGSTSADLPSQGVLHNVKGRAKEHDSGMRGNMAEQLKKLLSMFRVR